MAVWDEQSELSTVAVLILYFYYVAPCPLAIVSLSKAMSISSLTQKYLNASSLSAYNNRGIAFNQLAPRFITSTDRLWFVATGIVLTFILFGFRLRGLDASSKYQGFVMDLLAAVSGI